MDPSLILYLQTISSLLFNLCFKWNPISLMKEDHRYNIWHGPSCGKNHQILPKSLLTSMNPVWSSILDSKSASKIHVLLLINLLKILLSMSIHDETKPLHLLMMNHMVQFNLQQEIFLCIFKDVYLSYVIWTTHVL